MADSNSRQGEPKATDMTIKKLAARIKELRQQKGFSNYEQFANRHDINRTQYGRYEKGSDIRFSSLVRVVEGLGISLSEFFEGFEDRQP